MDNYITGIYNFNGGIIVWQLSSSLSIRMNTSR